MKIVINSIDPSLQWNPMYTHMRSRALVFALCCSRTPIHIYNNELARSIAPIQLKYTYIHITFETGDAINYATPLISIQLRFMSINLFAPLIKIIIGSSLAHTHTHIQSMHSIQSSSSSTLCHRHYQQQTNECIVAVAIKHKSRTKREARARG